MSVPRYESYAESRVERLGKLPSHWDVVALKRLASLTYGDALATDVRAEGGQIAVFGSNGPVGVHDEANTEAPVIFIGRKGSCGALNWSDVAGFAIDTVYFVDRRTSRVSLRWLYWLLHTLGLEHSSQDTGVPGLARETAHATRVPWPPPLEQSAIAAFLDQETGKIDALVEAQRLLIELLKEKRQAVISHAVTKGLDPTATMQDSGVEWLGEVPAHWEVTRLANLFREVAEPGDETLPVLSVSIHNGVSDEESDPDQSERKITRSDDRTKYKRVQKDDLVYNMMRAWQGGFGTVQVTGAVSPAYVVARPNRPEATRFVELLLRTPKAVEEMRRRSRGVTDFRLRLYWDEFKDMTIVMPTGPEVRDILSSVEEGSGRWERLADGAQSAILLLQERRAALISAAVTGKIDVRGLSSNQAEAA